MGWIPHCLDFLNAARYPSTQAKDMKPRLSVVSIALGLVLAIVGFAGGNTLAPQGLSLAGFGMMAAGVAVLSVGLVTLGRALTE